MLGRKPLLRQLGADPIDIDLALPPPASPHSTRTNESVPDSMGLGRTCASVPNAFHRAGVGHSRVDADWTWPELRQSWPELDQLGGIPIEVRPGCDHIGMISCHMPCSMLGHLGWRNTNQSKTSTVQTSMHVIGMEHGEGRSGAALILSNIGAAGSRF